MSKFLLEHDRPNCIGCTACEAVAPKFWAMHADGKSDIIGSKLRPDGWEEKEITDTDFEDNKMAAESCPVNVIHLKDEKGNKII